MPLSRDKQDLLEAELEPGEQLLWSGQPNPVQIARQGIVQCIFGLAWTAGVLSFGRVMWQHPEGASGPPGLIASGLFLMLFLLIGFTMLLTPLWLYIDSARTVYGITSQRALRISGRKARRIRSYGKDELGPVSRVERADGTGDLTIGERQVRDSDSGTKTETIEFFGILDVREVETILRNALLPDDQTQKT